MATAGNTSPTLKVHPNVKRKKAKNADELLLRPEQKHELNERLGEDDKNMWELMILHP
jgi:hypothetical protein